MIICVFVYPQGLCLILFKPGKNYAKCAMLSSDLQSMVTVCSPFLSLKVSTDCPACHISLQTWHHRSSDSISSATTTTTKKGGGGGGNKKKDHIVLARLFKQAEDAPATFSDCVSGFCHKNGPLIFAYASHVVI